MDQATVEALFVLPYLVSLSLSLTLAAYGLQRPQVPIAGPLVALALIQSSWTTGFLLKSFAVPLESKILWDSLLFIPFLLIPFFMLLVGRAFVGKQVLPFNWEARLALGVVTPLLILVFTDDTRHWVYPDARIVPAFPRGELSYSFTALMYLMSVFVLAVSILVFVRILKRARATSGRQRHQGYYLLAGMVIPVLFGFVTLSGLSIGPHRDFAPLSFGLGDLVIFWGVLRRKVLDILPIAYEVAFNSVEDPLVLIDDQGIIQAHNPAFLQFVASSVPLVGSSFPPQSASFEQGLDRFDVRISPVRDPNGRVVGNIHLFRDVGLLKSRQEHFRQRLILQNETLLQMSSDGIHILDAAGTLLEANAAFCQMLGYTHEELVGKHVVDWDRNGTKEDMAALAARLDGHAELFETKVQRKDGTVRELEINAVGVRFDDVLFYYASARDITDRHRQEKQLRTAQRLESLGVLAGGIAHDFNNILAGLAVQIDTAILGLKGGKFEEATPRLERTHSAIDRGKALTQRLLTFSKGGAPIQTDTKLALYLKEWMDFALAGSDIHGTCEVKPDLWNCRCDRNQISQVVNNLLINARQASVRGEDVILRATNALLGVPYVLIEVLDQGKGIPETARSQIFDPFFTTKANGTGLGLSVSYSIASRHGGWIEVDTNVPKGSVFRLFLPANPKVNSVEAGQREERNFPGNGLALVMDDESDILDGAAGMLKELGFAVLAAKNSQEALDLYSDTSNKGQEIGLFLLDNTISGGPGGMETARKLLELGSRGQVVIMSGYFGSSSDANSKEAPFFDQLPKPFSIAELNDILFRVLKPESNTPEQDI